MRTRLCVTTPQRGFVLVAVLVVILLASMVAMSLMFRLRADETAASVSSRSEQAWLAAMSGVQEMIQVLSHSSPGTTDWQQNPQRFRNRLVAEDGSDRWYFTIYSAPLDDSESELRFGVTDEAAKLNVNTAHTAELSKIHRLSADQVQSLRDFIDTDTGSRSGGGEQAYYSALARPYNVRNGPLNTLEELLLVRGFNTRVLYGEDSNRNFRLDPNEDDGDQTPPLDNSDGRLDLGVSRWMTVSSYDLNTDNKGMRRTDLNNPQSPFPPVEMPAGFTNFVAAIRAQHLRFEHVSHLLGARVKIKDDKGREQELESGIGKTELGALLEHFTTTREYRLPGLINVNTASVEVLATVPDIDEPLAEAIVSARRALSADRRTTIAWLFQEDVVDAERFKRIAPYLTARGLQFSGHVVGFGMPSGKYRVLDVVVDLATERPSVLYLRDITSLGAPFEFNSVQEKEGLGG